jgi:hypothetical protein
MFAQYLFNLLSNLLSSRRLSGHAEHHGACEDAYTARLGPLRLEVNRCFVLDHDDASVSARMPTPWGKLEVGYRVCLGEEQIRQPGFYADLQKPWQRAVHGRSEDLDRDFPF